MLTNDEIRKLLDIAGQHAALITELRQATQPVRVTLSADMAAALGTTKRRLVPFLSTCVDAVVSKLEVDDEALEVRKVTVAKELRGWLGDNQWGLIEKELYQAAVRDGRAFILTTWTKNGPKFSILEAFNGISGAHVFYDEHDNPNLGLNTWREEDADFLDLYYQNRIEKYTRGKESNAEWAPRRDELDESWPIWFLDDKGNSLGIYLTSFDLGKSDIADALQIGRDLNEATLDMLASSRTQGWPQRFVRGMRNPGVLTNTLGQTLVDPITNRPIRTQIRLSPGSIMQLGENADLGQLAATVPELGVIGKLLEILSFVTTVPNHYFTGQWPSGIALQQAESRLNHLVESHQGKLSNGIVALLRLTMRLSNHFAGTSFDPEQPITIPWHSPQVETEDMRIERDKAITERVAKLVEKGLMSKLVALREVHPDWSEDQVQEELTRLEGETLVPLKISTQPLQTRSS